MQFVKIARSLDLVREDLSVTPIDPNGALEIHLSLPRASLDVFELSQHREYCRRLFSEYPASLFFSVFDDHFAYAILACLPWLQVIREDPRLMPLRVYSRAADLEEFAQRQYRIMKRCAPQYGLSGEQLELRYQYFRDYLGITDLHRGWLGAQLTTPFLVLQ